MSPRFALDIFWFVVQEDAEPRLAGLYLILISLNLNSHIRLVAIVLDSTALGSGIDLSPAKCQQRRRGYPSWEVGLGSPSGESPVAGRPCAGRACT